MDGNKMKRDTVSKAMQLARHLWPKQVSKTLAQQLADLIEELRVSVVSGDVQLLGGKWYVTHTGLLRLARRKRCVGIHIESVPALSDSLMGRWIFKATVYTSRTCKGFVGYGDADPSNVSLACSRRRNACGRNPRRQPCPAQGLRHRHLLS